MTSYIRRWLPVGTSEHVEAAPPSPPVISISPLSNDFTETETEHDHDDDSPPAFPSPFSAQRIAPSTIPEILSDSQLMPPPPPPHLSSRNPEISVSSAPSSSMLAVPPTTTKRPAKPTKRGKVALAPGHSPLDWANLKSSGEDLRGVGTLLRIPPSELKSHNKRGDAWAAFNGKVYNITPYLSFHPGGERELMRAAGRDGTKLFALTHAWVNVDFMLDACLVGFLVAEPSS